MPRVRRYHPDMLIHDVLTSHPGATAVFERHGLACGGCIGADIETLRAVAQMHDVDVDRLIAELEALEVAGERKDA